MLKKYALYEINNKKIKFGLFIYGYSGWLLLGIVYDRFRRTKSNQEEAKKKTDVSLCGQGGLGIKCFTVIQPAFIAEFSIGSALYDENYDEAAKFFQYTATARKAYHTQVSFDKVFLHYNIDPVTNAVSKVASWRTSTLMEKSESTKMKDLFIDYSVFNQNPRAITGAIQVFELTKAYGFKISDYCRFSKSGSIKILCAEIEENRDANALIISEFADFFFFDEDKVEYEQWKSNMIKLYTKHVSQNEDLLPFQWYIDIMQV